MHDGGMDAECTAPAVGQAKRRDRAIAEFAGMAS
jgi:hypothetical protein